jgi:hypothetical protein
MTLRIEIQNDIYIGFRNVVSPRNGAEQKGMTYPCASSPCRISRSRSIVMSRELFSEAKGCSGTPIWFVGKLLAALARLFEDPIPSPSRPALLTRPRTIESDHNER